MLMAVILRGEQQGPAVLCSPTIWWRCRVRLCRWWRRLWMVQEEEGTPADLCEGAMRVLGRGAQVTATGADVCLVGPATDKY